MLSPEMIRRAYDVLTSTQWPGRNTFEGQELLVALREEVFPQDQLDEMGEDDPFFPTNRRSPNDLVRQEPTRSD